MISMDMRKYNVYEYSDIVNDYGQLTLNKEAAKGQIKMCIYLSSQTTTDNILYREATYIGLTQADVKDTNVIEYGEELLKVLYINKKGRYKQVYLQKV